MIKPRPKMTGVYLNRRCVHSDFFVLVEIVVLQMLGEINLQQWRCIAELVDNYPSSFAFLSASSECPATQ